MIPVRRSFGRSFEFACHSKACAPPPVGTGGSTGRTVRVSSKALKKLHTPDEGFTLSTNLRPMRSGYAVALKGSDKLVTDSDGFDSKGNPSPKLVALVKDRISAAMGAEHPKGTKVALGGWHNPDDDKIEINVTVVFPKTREQQAIKFAKEQDQIALFALHRGEVVMTGGTGGDRATE